MCVDLGLAQWFTIEGVRVPVVPLEQLLEYKTIIDRVEDRADVAEIRGKMPGAFASPERLT